MAPRRRDGCRRATAPLCVQVLGRRGRCPVVRNPGAGGGKGLGGSDAGYGRVQREGARFAYRSLDRPSPLAGRSLSAARRRYASPSNGRPRRRGTRSHARGPGGVRAFIKPLRASGRLGTVLSQYPRWFAPGDRGDATLDAIRDEFADAPIAVKFRNASWAEPVAFRETTARLRALWMKFVGGRYAARDRVGHATGRRGDKPAGRQPATARPKRRRMGRAPHHCCNPLRTLVRRR